VAAVQTLFFAGDSHERLTEENLKAFDGYQQLEGAGDHALNRAAFVQLMHAIQQRGVLLQREANEEKLAAAAAEAGSN
jgi:hypothetical protein